jgi:hypothetical protein
MTLKILLALALVAALALGSLTSRAQQAAGPANANYQLVVNGQTMDVEAGKEFTVTTPKGETVRLEVREKAIRTFQDSWVTFQLPVKLTVAETEQEGVRQLVMMNATGAGLIIQEYKGIDPADVIDFMITQLVKDEAKAGYKMAEKPYSLKLADGKQLRGKTKTVTQKNKQMVYDLGAWSGENEGLLIVSFQSLDSSPDDKVNQQLIDDVLKTLKIRR